jgi:hypothetical protein
MSFCSIFRFFKALVNSEVQLRGINLNYFPTEQAPIRPGAEQAGRSALALEAFSSWGCSLQVMDDSVPHGQGVASVLSNLGAEIGCP